MNRGGSSKLIERGSCRVKGASGVFSKNPGLRAFHLAGRNVFRFISFNKYQKYFFPFWLLASARKKLAFA